MCLCSVLDALRCQLFRNTGGANTFFLLSPASEVRSTNRAATYYRWLVAPGQVSSRLNSPFVRLFWQNDTVQGSGTSYRSHLPSKQIEKWRMREYMFMSQR